MSSGFVTSVWGAPAWLFLHCIAFNYSPERKTEYMEFFKYLADVLPCGACRTNYKQIISEGPLRLTEDRFKSRETVSLYLFLIHNKVQNDIYKKSKLECNKPMYKNTKKDYKIVKSFYEKFRAKCTKTTYGCVKQKTGFKLRSQIRIKLYNKTCNEQKTAIII